MTRTARHTAWLQCACSAVTLASASLPAPNPAPQAIHLVNDLPSRIHRVWRLQWGNRWKETWWRLLLHGVPGAGGHGIAWARGSECVCGWRAADAKSFQHLGEGTGVAAQSVVTTCFRQVPARKSASKHALYILTYEAYPFTIPHRHPL
eukprot:294917-Pelagomonas_calceolata.AAC.1